MEWISVHPEPKNDTEAGLVWEAPSKIGAKKTESDGGREKERRTFSSSPHFSSSSLLHAAPNYLEA